jgi:hypothetical protein
VSRRTNIIRWALVGAAAILLVVFIAAQTRGDVDVSYGTSPSRGGVGKATGEPVTLPSTGELSAMLGREPVVRLPGSVARWDERRVREAIGDADLRILVTPPGLSDDQRDLIREVEAADLRVVGTETSGGGLQSSSSDLVGWRSQFATGDVTSQLLALIARIRDQPDPGDLDLISFRAPTTAELDTVAADLRADGFHAADGATAAKPEDDAPLVVALPRQPFGEPVPEYGPALARMFPDQPVVVMYGEWVEYHGPSAEEFVDVASGSFYGQFGNLIARSAYPQSNVLNAYLGRVQDVRYAGLFDRPLPYQPFDPLRVTLPALPWVFAACVLAALVLSVRARPRPAATPTGQVARIAGLTTLAIEMSALSRHPALVRAIGTLNNARTALDSDLSERHLRRMLADAEHELDIAARDLGRADYRPGVYLAGGI